MPYVAMYVNEELTFPWWWIWMLCILGCDAI